MIAAMKLIDVHSHWGTKRGYPLQTEEELAVQRQTWNSEPRYHTEGEMALPADETLDDLEDVELESGESPAEEVQDEVGPMADADLADVEIED